MISRNLIKLSILLCFSLAFSNVGLAVVSSKSEPASVSNCQRRLLGFKTSKKILKTADAIRLAEIIAVDEESQRLISNPWIAQYIYVNFFADEVGDKESQVALMDLFNDVEASHVDIFTLVNETLADKLSDPKLKSKIREVEAFEQNLRPSKTKTKLANFAAKLKQVRGMFSTIRRLKKIVDKGFSLEVLDQGLFDFYGATQLGLRESQMRPWDTLQGGYSSIRPGQILNMSPSTWSAIAHFASETEMPIHDYSTNSGDALRGLLPSVSLFMGRTLEQYQARMRLEELEGDNRQLGPFCSNVWCGEEARHEVAVGTIANHISGRIRDTPMSYEADKMGDFSDPEYGLKHLIGRNSSEWNANSVYLFLMAHSDQSAHIAINNVRSDETKHMAIFSAAYKYFFGNQLWKRTKGMLDKIMQLKKEASVGNSNGSVLSGDGPSLLEMAITHLLVEVKVQKFIRSLPLKTMTKFFDSEVTTIKPPESDQVSQEKQRSIDIMIAKEKGLRARLARWTPSERRRYEALKQVELDHGALIESLILHRFNSFYGAEVPNSLKAQLVIQEIDNLDTGFNSKINKRIQMSLHETLRDYQIMNNRFVRSKGDLGVRLKNAREGFEVVKLSASQAQVLRTEWLSSSHLLVRLSKPKGLEKLEAGEAFRVTVNLGGRPVSRVLSLANSPEDNYLEFAVGVSNSDFKQSLTRMATGQLVEVETVDVGMKYSPSVPSVFIAGGIGITPMRSMIQLAQSQNFPASTQLIYANRSEIPFMEEFDNLERSSRNFSVTHVLSQPNSSWNGERGRVGTSLLRRFVDKAVEGTRYYIVAAPQMVTAIKSQLLDLGVEEGSIFIEVFANTAQANESARVDGDTSQSVAGEEDPIVCFCQQVTYGQLQEAIAGGASTLSDIQSSTNAVTGCGGCKCRVEDMLGKACK